MRELNETYIIDQYQKGKTQKQIALDLGTYNTSIRRVLLRNNIHIRGNSEVQRKVKHNFLEDVDNPDVQYWIGLLATDGCIAKKNTIVLDLQTRDKAILEDLIKFSGYPIKLLNTKHKKTGIVSKRVSFTHEGICKTLKSLGITKRKSLTLELKIPLTPSLLRGIIDGDGGFSRINKDKARLQIHTGSKKFADQLYKYLKTLGFNPTLTKSNKGRKTTYYSINMFRQKELSQLYHLLYDDAKYFIKRKYLKLGSLLGKLSNENVAKTGKP